MHPYQDSSQPLDARIDDLLSRLEPHEKMRQLHFHSAPVERLGIPEYNWWNECLHGVARNGRATVFPQVIGLAAAWDADLARRVASYTGAWEAIEIRRAAFHDTADGRRLLVTHGDAFDAVVVNARWLAHVGDWAYVTVLGLNTLINAARRKLGLPYWSVSAYLKHKVKKSVEYIGQYERVLADEAKRRKVDGIICGHIHNAEMRDIDGVLYCNDGDWVESCTALVEHHTGELEILNWAEMKRRLPEMIKTAA